MILAISKEQDLISGIYLVLIIFLALNPHRIFLFFVSLSALVSTEIIFKFAINIDYGGAQLSDFSQNSAIKYVISIKFIVVVLAFSKFNTAVQAQFLYTAWKLAKLSSLCSKGTLSSNRLVTWLAVFFNA